MCHLVWPLAQAIRWFSPPTLWGVGKQEQGLPWLRGIDQLVQCRGVYNLFPWYTLAGHAFEMRIRGSALTSSNAVVVSTVVTEGRQVDEGGLGEVCFFVACNGPPMITDFRTG